MTMTTNRAVTTPVWKIALWSAITGGIGIPVLFLVAWQVVLNTLHGTEAMSGVMAWFEAFHVMFWPSSMFLVVRAPGDSSGELRYLIVLILINVGVYALLGLAVALARRSRAAQLLLATLLIAVMYALNEYWSQHLASFVIGAIVLALVLIAFFRKFGLTARQTAN